jgi:hypothetical protein
MPSCRRTGTRTTGSSSTRTNPGKCGIGSNDHAGHVWFDEFTQPSAGTWHHWMIVFDRTTPINKAIIDGTSQTLTGGTHAAPVAFDTEVAVCDVPQPHGPAHRREDGAARDLLR